MKKTKTEFEQYLLDSFEKDHPSMLKYVRKLEKKNELLEEALKIAWDKIKLIKKDEKII